MKIVLKAAVAHAKDAALAAATHLEIATEDGGWFLMRYGADGALLADTWHMSSQEAAEQASSEYDLEAWQETARGSEGQR